MQVLLLRILPPSIVILNSKALLSIYRISSLCGRFHEVSLRRILLENQGLWTIVAARANRSFLEPSPVISLLRDLLRQPSNGDLVLIELSVILYGLRLLYLKFLELSRLGGAIIILNRWSEVLMLSITWRLLRLNFYDCFLD